MIKTKIELLEELKKINKRAGAHPDKQVFALALAYIVNDICPDDRTTKWIFRKREVKK